MRHALQRRRSQETEGEKNGGGNGAAGPEENSDGGHAGEAARRGLRRLYMPPACGPGCADFERRRRFRRKKAHPDGCAFFSDLFILQMVEHAAVLRRRAQFIGDLGEAVVLLRPFRTAGRARLDLPGVDRHGKVRDKGVARLA